jgi:hypothetical protein
MTKMQCTRTDCFYCAKGDCVNMSVLSAEKCVSFLHKMLARSRAKPHPVNLAILRKKLEAHAPTIGGTHRLTQRQVFYLT